MRRCFRLSHRRRRFIARRYINGKPVLIIGHTYFPLPADAHAAAVAFLAASGAYIRTEGVDA